MTGFVGITLLGSGWRKVSARGGKDYIIVPTMYRLVYWFRKRRALKQGGRDYIIVPTRYRLLSWFRKRRSLKHEVIDETLEPDSSDQ
ncbi:MAG: hypothetical protein ACXACG_02735 [Candidatus Thorarchaeota archaeon]